MEKNYIQPGKLRLDSYKLAKHVLDSGWIPNYMIALWRGGAPIGCYVHEFFKWHGHSVDHVAIRTSRYTGIGQAESGVEVHSLSYVLDKLKPDDKVLIVDDVWDSGTTIHAIYAKFGNHPQRNLKTAVVYYKPLRNKLAFGPDYWVHTSEEWLVFPHELEGMSVEEVASVMGREVAELLANH